jgi:putative transposase
MSSTAASALLTDWPLPRPTDWIEYVNLPQSEAEEEAIRRSLDRGSPCGHSNWTETVAKQLDLQSTLRRRGRPRNPPTPRP